MLVPTIAYLFAIVYIVVDVVYISLARPAYDRAVKAISGEPIPTGRKGAVAAAMFAYIAMALGWIFLVVPSVNHLRAHGYSRWSAGLIAGIVYGFALYGVFNGSLYAMFRNWGGRIFTQDMLWGVSWTTIITLAYAMMA